MILETKICSWRLNIDSRVEKSVMKQKIDGEDINQLLKAKN